MNITAYIQGFNAYLELEGKNENKQYATAGSTASIFMYSEEFKEYMNNEIGVNVDSMSITDLLNMEVVNGKLVDPNAEDTSVFSSQEGEEQDAQAPEEGQAPTEGDAKMFDFINLFMEDETFQKSIDTDGNGELNKDEVNFFLNGIKGLDNDAENISMDDIFSAAKSIQDGTFDLEALNAAQENPAEETPAEEAPAEETPAENTPAVDNTPAAQETPASSSPSSGTANGDYTPSVDNTDGTQEKTLDNMTKDELKTELSSATSEVNSKQSKLEGILNGSDSGLQELKGKVDNAYTAYQDELKKVDENMATQVDNLKGRIDAKQAEIDKKDIAITKQEMTVSDCENSYNNAISSRENLESVRSQLKSTDTSNMDEDKKASLQSQISELDTKIAEAKQAETDAKTKWDEEKENLQTLKDEKTELKSGDEGLDKLNDEMSALETQINDKYPSVMTTLNAYKDAKQSYDAAKETAVSSAKTDLQTAKDYENKVKSAYNNAENKEIAAKYNPDPKDLYNAEMGNAIAQLACNTDGTVGYCLRGVAKTLKKYFGSKTELSHLGSAYMAANALRTDPELSKHFKEVQVDRSELANLPAGAIVVWDKGAPNASAAGKKHGHISIALGNGKESSDHIQKQMTNRQSQFWVFYPVG